MQKKPCTQCWWWEAGSQWSPWRTGVATGSVVQRFRGVGASAASCWESQWTVCYCGWLVEVVTSTSDGCSWSACSPRCCVHISPLFLLQLRLCRCFDVSLPQTSMPPLWETELNHKSDYTDFSVERHMLVLEELCRRLRCTSTLNNSQMSCRAPGAPSLTRSGELCCHPDTDECVHTVDKAI